MTDIRLGGVYCTCTVRSQQRHIGNKSLTLWQSEFCNCPPSWTYSNHSRSQYLHERQCHILWGMPPAASQLRLVRTRGTYKWHAFFSDFFFLIIIALTMFHIVFAMCRASTLLHDSKRLAVTSYCCLSRRISEEGGPWRHAAISFKTCRGGAARRNISSILPVAFQCCGICIWAPKGQTRTVWSCRSCPKTCLSNCDQVSVQVKRWKCSDSIFA